MFRKYVLPCLFAFTSLLFIAVWVYGHGTVASASTPIISAQGVAGTCYLNTSHPWSVTAEHGGINITVTAAHGIPGFTNSSTAYYQNTAGMSGTATLSSAARVDPANPNGHDVWATTDVSTNDGATGGSSAAGECTH